MNTYKIAGVVLGAAMVLAPLAASAATFTNVQFSNGDVTVQGTGGSTVTATFRVVVPANETVEYVQTDVIGDSLGPVDTSVGGELGLQEGIYYVPVQIKLPPNVGTFQLNIQGAGKYGAMRSINGSDNVVGSGTFSNALRVVSSGSSDSNFGGTGMSIADLIAALKAAGVSVGSSTPATPTTSAVCSAYAQANAGTQANVYSDANVRLQGFLLSQGASIPALKAGAAFGFYGNQTTAAVGWFNSLNHCN